MNDTVSKKVAGILARSLLLKKGAELWRKNQQDWNIPLSKFQKALTGIYLVLHDYSEGQFPPRYDNRETTYSAEIHYGEELPGISKVDFVISEMRKPFWFGRSVRQYMSNFCEIIRGFEKCGVQPPQRLLEVGCGSGWTAELLAIMGYNVVATNLVPESIELAGRRVSSIKTRGVPCQLDYRVAPMESVADALGEKGGFDAVFVYEALHHAFDWREAIRSAYDSLKPGGWLFIFNEPNAIHTLSSYRVGRLSNTHEIGFWPHEVIGHLRQTGFSNIEYLKAKHHFYLKPFSMVARRPAVGSS
jgi:2-polyprenyl-3-methyl-5-hydroxy-6-metoxy-1,4-benzoquinol methylase